MRSRPVLAEQSSLDCLQPVVTHIVFQHNPLILFTKHKHQDRVLLDEEHMLVAAKKPAQEDNYILSSFA